MGLVSSWEMSTRTYRESQVKTEREDVHLQAKERSLTRNLPSHVHTSTFDFWPPAPWESMFLKFQPPGLWYFVMGALAKGSKGSLPIRGE